MPAKPAPLDGSVFLPKGQATPSAPMPPAEARQTPVKQTVNIPPALYVRLQAYTLQFHPKRSIQDTLVEALTRLLDEAGV